MRRETLVEVLPDILEDYGVDFAVLFGSFASGDFDEESDVDLMIWCEDDVNIVHLANEIRRETGHMGDIVSVGQLENSKVSRIIDDGLVLVGSGIVDFIEEDFGGEIKSREYYRDKIKKIGEECKKVV